MSQEEIASYESRAEAELRLARQADDLLAALAHRKRADRYFEHIRTGLKDRR